MLKSNLCDYSDANIVAKFTRDLLTAAANENDKALKGFAFKNNAPFRSCIKKLTIYSQVMQKILIWSCGCI